LRRLAGCSRRLPLSKPEPHYRMRRDLSTPIAPGSLPAGIALVPFTVEAARASRELMNRVYEEGLGDDGITFDGWWQWLTTDADYDETLMYVAAQDGVVVGFCHCWRRSFIKDLVVDAAVRRRGLGTALLTLALTDFARLGSTYVDLKTDVDNVTAQSLYQRLGFEIVERIG
jgi:ribosomal protein S18 acetylase RimI-like enzyme